MWILTSIYAVGAQSSETVVKVLPGQSNVREGETLIVNITLSNVQNLYGIDVTFSWNNSALRIVSATNHLGVESNADGVLHVTFNYPIEVAINDISQEAGQYHIAATSQGEAAPFSGSGTIATLTFNVTSAGQSSLTVLSELADHPEVGETNSELITHIDIGATVNAEAIPEFPQIVVFALILVGATVGLLGSKKLLKKNYAQAVAANLVFHI